MNIGIVAERSGVPHKTIRYYESIGLIASAPRGENGYRLYDETDVQTLRFIQRARGLGFSVKEVAELLALWCDRERTSAEVNALALKRITEIEHKVRELEGLKSALIDLEARCHGDERPDCPIIDELAGEDNSDRTVTGKAAVVRCSGYRASSDRGDGNG